MDGKMVFILSKCLILNPRLLTGLREPGARAA